MDPDDRAIFLERVLGPEVSFQEYVAGSYAVLRSWARYPFLVVDAAIWEGGTGGEAGDPGDGGAEEGRVLALRMRAGREGDVRPLEKELRFLEDGTLEAHFRWDPSAFPENALFTTELTLEEETRITATPQGEVWTFPVATFSKSERGFDETVQGHSYLVRWPVTAGGGCVRIHPG